MKAARMLMLSAILACLPAGSALADGDVELVEIMSILQYFAHKTALAIDSQNRPLAEFYAHELEEFLGEAAAIKSYDGQPVGDMVKSIGMPPFLAFETALKSGEWDKASDAFDGLIQSCNRCHRATGHGFINIERRSDNPYMQSFGSNKSSGASGLAR